LRNLPFWQVHTSKAVTQSDWVVIETDGFDPVRQRFAAYTMNHMLRHVHGFYADIEVIADLRADGNVSLAKQTDAIRPSNASKSDVRYILAALPSISTNL
jgi:hypothetical protein